MAILKVGPLSIAALALVPALGLSTPAEPTAEGKAKPAEWERDRKKIHDDEVTQTLNQYQRFLGEARGAGERAAAVMTLGGGERDPRILAELTRHLSDADLVRDQAIAAVGAYRRDERAAQALGRALAANPGNPAVLEKALQALGTVGHPSSIPVMASLLPHAELAVGAAAARALGASKCAAAIEPLLAEWESLNHRRKMGDRGAEERLWTMNGPLQSSLASLTGRHHALPEEYRVWWVLNRSTFQIKLPQPPVFCWAHFGLIDLPGPPLPTGGILHEVWTGLPGDFIADGLDLQRLSGPPSSARKLGAFDAPAEIGDHYLARVRGYLHPPADGDYTFWIGSDDESELYLSSDESPAHMRLIARSGCVNRGAWHNNPGKGSSPAALRAGRRYYIEALHKEGVGYDFLTVMWSTPQGQRGIIPGSCLSPYVAPDRIATTSPPPPVPRVAPPAPDVRLEPPRTEAEEKAWLTAMERERRRAHDDAVQKALEEYRKAMGLAKTPNDRAAIVWRLGASERDARIATELSARLSDAGIVRERAAAALGQYPRDDRAAQALAQALAPNAGNPAFQIIILDALGAVGHPAAAPIAANYLKDKDPNVAAAAARALGEMYTVAAIEPLLATWEDLEKKKVGPLERWANERLGPMARPMKISLTRLTGQNLNSADEYRNWWKQSRATHRIKEPPPAVLCRKHLAPIPPPGKPLPPGSIQLEVWSGIRGELVVHFTGDRRLETAPHGVRDLALFEAPAFFGNDYGARIRGYLHPPASGPYTFWLAAGAHEAELHLSPDEDPAHKVLLVRAQGTPYRAWSQNQGGRSEPVQLKTGRLYYIEALQKQGWGDNWLSVAWDPPGGVREVIPGKHLSPYTVLDKPSVAKVPAAGQEGPSSPGPGRAVAERAGNVLRAINLNGPAVSIDGATWESGLEAPNCLVFGAPREFAVPPSDPPVSGDRARMLATAIANAGTASIILGRVPPGSYRIYLHVWSETDAARFSVTLQGRPLPSELSTGAARRWQRLGPWTAEVTDGAVRLVCTGGPVNFCGIELCRP